MAIFSGEEEAPPNHLFKPPERGGHEVVLAIPADTSNHPAELAAIPTTKT